ncbi:MAG: hypothetical protein JXL84_09885 [Deltaproteobacteria bacterium]|nr:hypothetical protein [Deltaproteobacteria bacterium]
MTLNSTCSEPPFDFEKPTDIEVAMFISRLLDDSCKSDMEAGRPRWKESILLMVREALRTMTNPFARKFLADQLREREVLIPS